MRLRTLIVFAGLPVAAFAQEAALPVQKAPQPPPAVALTAAEAGLPASADAAKTADLAASKAQEAQLSTFDTDKIADNAPLLALRQKALSYGPQDTGDLDPGIPTAPADPKVAELAVSAADRIVSAYDEDKIDGNDYSGDFVEGPLSPRQKLPSELAAGTDPAAFGQPATDAPKEADLGLSKAELAVPSVEDNDKIVGNPYVAPPLLPRQKLASVLPDPVVDPDMGQPATEAPKVDLAVSKAAEAVPTVEDNDKIAGNPVVSPPLTARSKGPAWEPALTGLTDDELGLPLAPAADKTADIGASKSAEAVTSEYDEHKIAGNSYEDPAYTDDSYIYDPEPPAELVAQVRALLDDPATREATIAASGTTAPPEVASAFASFLGILYDAPAVRDRMAYDIARVFMDMGMTPNDPAALGRVAAIYMAAFGEDEARLGTALRTVEEQRTYLTNLLRVAQTLPPAQCATYLDQSMEPSQRRRLLLAAMTDWSEEDRNTVFIHRAAAILAHLEPDGTVSTLSDTEVQQARASLGPEVLAAIDGKPNATDLLAAYGSPYLATADQNCTVQSLILQTALAKAGADGDLVVRYLVEYGWQL